MLLIKRKNFFNFASKLKIASPNLITNLIKGQVIGFKTFCHTDLYKLVVQQKKTLGHLAPVHCVCYDQTGLFIFTVNIYIYIRLICRFLKRFFITKGSNDCLIKVWSTHDGRLLRTLKGHKSRINDLNINSENTLLASVNSDKTIRIRKFRMLSYFKKTKI